MPDVDSVHDIWSLAALIVVTIGLAVGAPVAKRFLSPDAAPTPPPDAPPDVVAAVRSGELSGTLATLLQAMHTDLADANRRLDALEAEHGVVVRDLDDVVDALAEVIAWLDRGSPHPPPVISDAVRAIIARRSGGTP